MCAGTRISLRWKLSAHLCGLVYCKHLQLAQLLWLRDRAGTCASSFKLNICLLTVTNTRCFRRKRDMLIMFLDSHRNILQWEKILFSDCGKAEVSMKLNGELRPCLNWHKTKQSSVFIQVSLVKSLGWLSAAVRCHSTYYHWPGNWLREASLENKGWPWKTLEEQSTPASWSWLTKSLQSPSQTWPTRTRELILIRGKYLWHTKKERWLMRWIKTFWLWEIMTFTLLSLFTFLIWLA